MADEDLTFEQRIKKEMKTFRFDGSRFYGEGWRVIQDKIRERQHILIGEDHFSNEIPKFVQALADIVTFDNFYIEVDPFSTELIKQHFSQPEDEKERFLEKYSDILSFYALQPEYELLEIMMKNGSYLLGADQIVMYADRLLCDDLSQTTAVEKAREIYHRISKQSEEHLRAFLQNPQDNPMYFMTTEFGHDLEQLKKLDLSQTERQIINAMEESREIYETQSHNRRVKLLLNQVLNDYPIWKDAKNLFKYGANHMARGESFLYVRDIGNLISTIAHANYSNSYHVMILGMSGNLGSPFPGFPDNEVDSKTGFYLSHLTPFFDVIRSRGDMGSWYSFDLHALRQDLVQEKYQLEVTNLVRAIKGFDLLVIIPEVTPAKHLSQVKR